MVDVHAGQVAHRVADIELDHADDTLSVLLAAIKGAGRQVLDKTDPLGDFHLFFLGQLARWSGHIGGGVVHWGGQRVHCLLLDVLMLRLVLVLVVLVDFLLDGNISATATSLS